MHLLSIVASRIVHGVMSGACPLPVLCQSPALPGSTSKSCVSVGCMLCRPALARVSPLGALAVPCPWSGVYQCAHVPTWCTCGVLSVALSWPAPGVRAQGTLAYALVWMWSMWVWSNTSCRSRLRRGPWLPQPSNALRVSPRWRADPWAVRVRGSAPHYHPDLSGLRVVRSMGDL
jgi:hypothetical protein